MKHFLFSVLIIFYAFQLKAQTIEIRDKTSQEEIEDVLLKSGSITLHTGTGKDGKVDISVFRNSDSITVKAFGYKPFSATYPSLLKSPVVFLDHEIFQMDEVVLSIDKFGEKKSETIHQVMVVDAGEMKFMNQPTSADMLQQTGNVLVQKSQLGGGSPVIRGFEANKILIMVDGVRMNNAIFRGGHLQNIINLEDASLERTEVLFGPGSVIYGSDALGGVIHLYTKKPLLADSAGRSLIKANALTRYSTACQEKTGHADVNIGFKKVAFLTSFTLSDFGDLRQGKVRNDFYGDWGKRIYYAQRINGKDSMVKNDEPAIQVGSGYHQYNIVQKVLFKPTPAVAHLLNVQYSTTSNIPRYDRLTDLGSNGKLRNAEWYYGPQKRFFASYALSISRDEGIFSKALITAAYQNMQESRNDRRFNAAKLNHRNEELHAYSLNLDFEKKFSKQEFQYGAEVFYNKVNSKAFAEDIITGKESKLDTRYPDGGSTMQMYAVYVGHSLKLSERLKISEGIRLNRTSLHSGFKDTTFFPFPFNEVTQSNNAVNGNIGLIFSPGADWQFSVKGATGFRAPNVDDLAKVFESVPGYLIIPNPFLKPEYTYNAEAGISKRIKNQVEISGRFFYTWYQNAITVKPSDFGGKDSVYYNGQNSKVVTTVNANKAHIYGFNLSLVADVTDAFSIMSTVNYTFGRIRSDSVPYPLDHIPPVFGRTSFNLQVKKLRGEFFVLYNGWKRLSDYNLVGEDNIQYATPKGMPAWLTLNIRASYHVTKNLVAQLGLENILDQNYRVFASGISAPGRNLVLSLRGKF